MSELSAGIRILHKTAAAWLLLVALIVGAFSSFALAIGQVTTRSITLSSSLQGATSVTYTLTFTPASNAQEIILDFCDNSPGYNDTCTVSGAGTDVPLTTSGAASGWTVTSLAGNHTLKLTAGTLTATTPKTVTITGITNPTNVGSVGSFYARILTYTTGGAASYVPNGGGVPTLGSPVDVGGVALTTTNNIAITSKVFETLSLCVYQTSCTSGNGNAANLTLGDPTTQALSTSSNYINSNALYTLATNAGSGVIVVLKGNTLCRDSTPANCTSGSADARTITPRTAGAASALLAAGNEQFSMCANKNGSAALTVATTYSDTINNCTGLATGTYSGTSLFGWDNTNATGASGSTVLSSSGAVPSVSGNFVFAAGIAATTEAGVYSASINMIATSTF